MVRLVYLFDKRVIHAFRGRLHVVTSLSTVITFGQEVELVWSARWSMGKILFFLVGPSHPYGSPYSF
jgi:hypothetical protein